MHEQIVGPGSSLPNLTVAELIDSYYEFRKSQNPDNPDTGKGDKVPLAKFEFWLRTIHRTRFVYATDLRRLGHLDVIAFLSTLKGFKANTLKNYLIAIGGLLRFAYLKKYVDEVVTKTVPMPKIPKRFINPLSQARIQLFFDFLASSSSTWPSRDLLIFELLYGSLLNTTNLVRLNWDDIDLDKREI